MTTMRTLICLPAMALWCSPAAFGQANVMDFWANDHYNWVYRTVMERPRDIGNLVVKHKLAVTQ